MCKRGRRSKAALENAAAFGRQRHYRGHRIQARSIVRDVTRGRAARQIERSENHIDFLRVRRPHREAKARICRSRWKIFLCAEAAPRHEPVILLRFSRRQGKTSNALIRVLVRHLSDHHPSVGRSRNIGQHAPLEDGSRLAGAERHTCAKSVAAGFIRGSRHRGLRPLIRKLSGAIPASRQPNVAE